jgi:hypothetical protein
MTQYTKYETQQIQIHTLSKLPRNCQNTHTLQSTHIKLVLKFDMDNILPAFPEYIRFSAIFVPNTVHFKTINEQASRQAGSINCKLRFQEFFYYDIECGDLYNIVGVISRPWLEWPKNQSLIPERTNILLLSKTF